MAPGFLSKFHKSTGSRERTVSSSRSPSPGRSSTQVPSISLSTSNLNSSTTDTTTTTNTSTNRSSRNPSGANTPAGDQDTQSLHSTKPSVTIGVIPPSPRTINSETGFPAEIDSPLGDSDTTDDEEPSANELARRGSLQQRRNDNSSHNVSPPRENLSFTVSTDSPDAGAPDFREDSLPTPTPTSRRPVRPTQDRSSTIKASPVTRALTPSSSTGNLRYFVQQTDANNPEDMSYGETITAPASAGVHRSPSGRSQTIAVPATGAHSRYATTPTGRGSLDLAASPTSSSGNDDDVNMINGMSPISESPKPIRNFSQPMSMDPPNRTQTLNPNLLVPGGKDSDSISIVSTSGKKRKGWRRPSLNSQAKKPTGLAAAIAGSGLAMANPGLSPQLAPQIQSPVITPHTTSPTKQNGTPPGTQKREHHQHHRHVASASAASVTSAANSLDAPRRNRQPSLSLSNRSENSEGMYDSGLEGASSEEESGSDDELNLDDDIPVTGFAVASNKRNADFHELFTNIPEGDYLIEDYGCALQREILIQGRIYISENHICFHANIFGWITDLSIPIYEIVALEKKMTAFVIPNAIQITTRQNKYSFASFLSRDTTFDVIYNIWRLARPEDGASNAGSTRGSLEYNRAGMEQLRESGHPPDAALLEGAEGAAVEAGAANGSPAKKGGKPKLLTNKVTQCACGKKGEHYSETALETIVPGTPDKIYNLMFASGFIKDFMKGEQKLLDLQISDWAPTSAGSKLLARNMSYIKPLNASLGPKQTKCEIRDETIFCDFEDHVITITTTRTPDVPSGGVFSVKTRTCIMWASAASTKVVVTTQVEWTGRSFIKGIINQSAIDGQKTYHADLDRAMRIYIQQHQSEFVPEGIEAIAVAPIEPQTPGIPTSAKSIGDPLSQDVVRKTREHERNQRSLQWAYDTFEGAYGVAKQSTNGALELIKDAWDQSTSTTILIFIIVILVFSNLWTLTMVGRREDVGRRKEMQKTEEKERWVQGIVTGLWEELAAGTRPGPGLPPPSVPSPMQNDWQQELANINKTLDAVEERVRLIRESLNTLD